MVSFGKILKTQGRHGGLKLKINDLRLLEPHSWTRVHIGRKGKTREYGVESLREAGGAVFLKLEGVDSLSQAEELVGFEIFIPVESLRPAEDGHFYIFQLVGCSVLVENGENIGRVTDVLEISGNDLLVVDRKGTEVLIPFTRSICVKVDSAGREIIVRPPAGLLELNEI